MTADFFLLLSPLLLLVPFFTNLVASFLIKKGNVSKACGVMRAVAVLGALIAAGCLYVADWGTLGRMLASDNVSTGDAIRELLLIGLPIAVVALSPAFNGAACVAMHAGNAKRARNYLLWNNWLLSPLFIGIPYGILYVIGLAQAFQH